MVVGSDQDLEEVKIKIWNIIIKFRHLFSDFLAYQDYLPLQMLNVVGQGFTGLKIPNANTANVKNERPFTCIQCNRKYQRKDSLMRHVRWECGKEPLFQCPFCPQRCKRKPHWIRHIKRQHAESIGNMENYLHSYSPLVDNN